MMPRGPVNSAPVLGDRPRELLLLLGLLGESLLSHLADPRIVRFLQDHLRHLDRTLGMRYHHLRPRLCRIRIHAFLHVGVHPLP